MNNNLIITIGREYGTGGREIGQKLALRLGISFYDRELITRAAKKTGFDEKLFEQLDKRATNSFLYSLTMFGSVGLNGMSLTDQLYLAQANIIRELAEETSCVIAPTALISSSTARWRIAFTASKAAAIMRSRARRPKPRWKRWISSALLITITIPARYGVSVTTMICASTPDA